MKQRPFVRSCSRNSYTLQAEPICFPSKRVADHLCDALFREFEDLFCDRAGRSSGLDRFESLAFFQACDFLDNGISRFFDLSEKVELCSLT